MAVCKFTPSSWTMPPLPGRAAPRAPTPVLPVLSLRRSPQSACRTPLRSVVTPKSVTYQSTNKTLLAYDSRVLTQAPTDPTMMAAWEPPLPATLSQDSSGFRVSADRGGKRRLGGAMKGYHNMNFSHRSSAAACGARGFSLLEMMIVCCLILIMTAISFMALRPALKEARANQAFESAMMPLRTARQRAIAERKQYIVCFGVAPPTGALTPMGAPTAQSIQIFRWDVGTALSAAVQVTAVTLPNDIQFQTLAGLPNGPTTVPDGFGNATTAIDFDQAVAGPIKNQVMFMPDGSAHDVNGNLNSGIVYVARNGDLFSSRAVTLYGATGRIRGWRLLNGGGGPKWFQQ